MTRTELPPDFHITTCPVPALDDLRAAIAWEQRTVRVFGREHLVPRLTAWAGDAAYTYSGVRHEPAPVPALVREIQAHAERVAGVRFNSVLANLYRDGRDSVAWHADDEPELGHEPVIASVSVGSARRFLIKRRATGEQWSVHLGDGALLVMAGESQRDYLHAVPKTSRAVGPRLNLTFRVVV